MLTDEQRRLVEGHMGMAYAAAWRWAKKTPPWVTADELISAASLGLCRAAGTFDPTRSVPFTAWAYRRVDGAILDELRALHPNGRFGDKAAPFNIDDCADHDNEPSTPDCADQAVTHILTALALAALDEQPPRHAHAVRRSYLDDQPHAVIGAELTVSESRVSQLRREGVTALRARLKW